MEKELSFISRDNNLTVLTEEELVVIDGGLIWWAYVVAVGAVAATLNELFDAGKNIGEFIYYSTH